MTAADGYSVVRSYSIASAPNLDKRFELTIERLANGEVSPYLTQEVAVGDRLEGKARGRPNALGQLIRNILEQLLFYLDRSKSISLAVSG